ncbi:MAG: hypothetical protein LJE84_01645 [Gammaproteobacteria bacterium]|jgi:hypothetical protein|nr:hypothetical protein [Gammaproteobacteria bacterium]
MAKPEARLASERRRQQSVRKKAAAIEWPPAGGWSWSTARVLFARTAATRALATWWGRTLVVAVVVLEIAWLGIGNGLLISGKLHGLLNKRPEKLEVSWESAWTLWPGRVFFDQLRVQVHLKKADLEFAMEDGSADIGLLAVPTKTFQLDDASISGITVVVRQLKEPREWPQRPKKKPWTIDLEDVVLDDVRGLAWNDTWIRLEGGVSGDFWHRVHGFMKVPEVSVDLRVTDVSGPGLTQKQDFRIFGDVEFAPFIPKEAKGTKLFRYLNGEISLQGPQFGLSFLEFLFRRAYELQFDGSGSIDTHFLLARGTLLEDSHLALSSPEMSARFLDYQAEGRGQIRLVVTDTPPWPLRADVRLADFQLRRHDAKQSYLAGADLGLALSGTGLNLGSGVEGRHFRLDLPSARITDIRAYNGLVPKKAGVEFLSGTGQLEGYLEADGEKTNGKFQLTSRGLRASLPQDTVTGDLIMTTYLRDGDLGTRRFRVDGTAARFENVQITGVKDLWWGSVTIRDGYMTWTNPVDLDADIELAMFDTRPLVAYFLKGRRIPLLGRLLTVRNIKGQVKVQTDKKRTRLDPVEIHGDGLSLSASLTLAGKQANGTLKANFHGIPVSFQIGSGSGGGGSRNNSSNSNSNSDRSSGSTSGNRSPARKQEKNKNFSFDGEG